VKKRSMMLAAVKTVAKADPILAFVPFFKRNVPLRQVLRFNLRLSRHLPGSDTVGKFLRISFLSPAI